MMTLPPSAVGKRPESPAAPFPGVVPVLSAAFLRVAALPDTGCDPLQILNV